MRVMKIGLCMTISCEKDTDLRRIKLGGLQLTQNEYKECKECISDGIKRRSYVMCFYNLII